MANDCVIYDFETLGQDPRKSAVVSLAILNFSEDRYLSDSPYEFEELVDNSLFLKFDVSEQVKKYSRVIDQHTLAWWKEQDAEAIKMLAPTNKDVSISVIYPYIMRNIPNTDKLKKAYTRGNTFDPIFLDCLMKELGNPAPFHWRITRDTRSMIEGLSYGSNLKNDFIPESINGKFIKHDPRHDIAIDVFRMQTLVRTINDV